VDRSLSVLQFLALLGPLLAAAGCGDPGKSLYPLEQSMEWTYQVVSASPNRSSKITVVNMPARMLAGRSVTPQKIEVNGQTLFQFMGEDSEGIFVLATQGPNAMEPEIVPSPVYRLHHPYESGTRWEVNSRFHVTIENADETVTVPAGTFESCVKVVTRSSLMEKQKIASEQGITWYCPGVGMVKSITKPNSNNMGESGELIQLESYSSSD
jgi:hypothetical protein